MSLAERNFEDHVTASLVDHGGYEAVAPAEWDSASGLFPDQLFAFIEATQPRAWARLVERLEDEDAARRSLLRRVAQEIENPGRMGVVDALRHPVSDQGVSFRLAYFRPAHGLTPELEAAYAANRLGVVRQLDVGDGEILDLVLTVNGIPVATAELKNALTGQTTDDAVEQYRRTRSALSPLLRRCAVHFALDTDTVMMTTRLAGDETRFLPFNRGNGGRAGNPAVEGKHRTHYLWENVWSRDAWLDIIGRFIHNHLDEETGKRTTIFPRYHQWDAVRRLVAHTGEHGAGRKYLVQHSAGSGKSNTIAWLAYRLAQLHDAADEKIFEKVIVVTDRTVLDDQLAATIRQFEHAPGMVARIDAGWGAKSTRLAEALTDTASKIVIVTLQTFPFVMGRLAELGGMREGRFAVIVDEAHSSQTGVAAERLRSVLTSGNDAADLAAAESAEAAEAAERGDAQDALAELVSGRGASDRLSFYAFTATPKHRTREIFGTRVGSGDDARYEAFHLYTMRQAIEEGFIHDVLANYVTYQTYWKIEKAIADDPSLDERRAKAAIARFVSLHPTSVAQKAQIIVDHFVEHTAHKIGGRAKAMVVTSSRLHAVRYKQAIDEYIATKGLTGQVAALVAFSGQVQDPPETFTEAGMNGFRESETAERFDTDDYHLLVVAEKFQTGFDQPLLHTMFVDKVLTDLSAVQTLSRLNRTAEGKEDTFVLDFRNDAEDIARAFAPFYDAAVAVPTDPNLMADDLTALRTWDVIHDADVEALALLLVGCRDDIHAEANALLDPAVERWHALPDDEREAFRDTLDRYVRLYSFLSLVVSWSDVTFESWYLYAKMLRRKITEHRSDRIDISDKVALTHLRMDVTFEGPIEVEPEDEVEARWGRGRMSEEAEAALSEIVTEMNDRFGKELTDEHRLTFDQLGAAMQLNETVVEAAKNNANYANFRDIVFTPLFLGTVINQMDANEEIFKIILSDERMRDLFTDYTARTVYDTVRG